MAMKAVIFGVDGILFPSDSSPADSEFLDTDKQKVLHQQLRVLFDFLRSKDIRPIVLTNRFGTITEDDGSTSTLGEGIERLFGPHKLYSQAVGNLQHFKPTKECIDELLLKEGLARHEVIMVGMSEDDFKTAVNSHLLFLNATWDRQESHYGFVFSRPDEIITFIDVFGLRDHLWGYVIDDGAVQYRSLAPFSTYKAEYADYSDVARTAAKSATSDKDFFVYSVISSLYFSGEIDRFDYIACVPGHKAGFGNPAMNEGLELVGKIFRKRYIPDLVVRHTTAASSRETRNRDEQPKPETQFDSINLTRLPLKTATERYKTPIKLKGKTVLVFDDFTTAGYSFEAVRHFLRRAGANIIAVSWLKTINRGYRRVEYEKPFSPFAPHKVSALPMRSVEYPYNKYLIDAGAPELQEKFKIARAAARKRIR